MKIFATKRTFNIQNLSIILTRFYVCTVLILSLCIACEDAAPVDYSNPSYNDPNTTTVTISTDMLEYETGEVISMSVRNGLSDLILYNSYGDRFWGIETYKDNTWINESFESGGGFQVTNEDLGDDCYIALYEIAEPLEMKANANVVTEWTQRICPYNDESIEKPRTVINMEPGTYRLLFYYGFETQEDNAFMIKDPQIAYSNSFKIR